MCARFVPDTTQVFNALFVQSNSIPMTTIALPIIDSAAFADPNVKVAASTGGTLLRLHGSNFGMVDFLVSLALTTADSIVLLAPNCTFVKHHAIVDCTSSNLCIAIVAFVLRMRNKLFLDLCTMVSLQVHSLPALVCLHQFS